MPDELRGRTWKERMSALRLSPLEDKIFRRGMILTYLVVRWVTNLAGVAEFQINIGDKL